ncbi:MAG: glycosyltransferase [Deltaproteobacteria bacterium]|nr:glycosyltransferase [Deltaproteobacteria bacterium]
MSRTHPDVCVVVAGRREYEGASGDIVFAGTLPPGRVRALYAAAEAVVVPSRWQEPLSRVLLEAAGAGLPVIATDAGGNAEIVVDGETGSIVPRNDPLSLAAAITRFLDAPADLRGRLGEAARRRMEAVFSESAILRRMESFYEGAMERHHGR